MERFIKLIKPIRYWSWNRGSDLGIDAIETINRNSDYFSQFEFDKTASTIKIENTFAKRIEHVLEQCTRVSYAVKHNLKANYFPIVLSGITRQLWEQ
jgi:arginase